MLSLLILSFSLALFLLKISHRPPRVSGRLDGVGSKDGPSCVELDGSRNKKWWWEGFVYPKQTLYHVSWVHRVYTNICLKEEPHLQWRC